MLFWPAPSPPSPSCLTISDSLKKPRIPIWPRARFPATHRGQDNRISDRSSDENSALIWLAAFKVGLRFDNKDRLLAPDCLIDHLLFTKQFVSIDDTDLPYLKQLLITSFTKYTWMIPKTANPNPRPYQQSHCTMSPIWPRVASEVCCSIPLLTMERRRDPNPAFFLGELRFLHILESWGLKNYRNSFSMHLV